MNTFCEVNGCATSILNVKKDVVPKSIEIFFNDRKNGGVLPNVGRMAVENVITYWAKSYAIARPENPVTLDWNDEFNTVTVTAAFAEGGFNGDLLHRNAIGRGERKVGGFNCGLVELFHEGYTPKGNNGTGGVDGVFWNYAIYPMAILFHYKDKEVAEWITEEEYLEIATRSRSKTVVVTSLSPFTIHVS